MRPVPAARGLCTSLSEFDLGPGLRLEAHIDAAEDRGVRARWEFGRWLLSERNGKKLPNGLLDRYVEATGESRTELQYRAQFAERYPDEAALSNALDNHRSWHAIINEALGPSSGRPGRDPVAPPTGRYSVLLGDPPWHYDDVKTPNRAVENHYPTMSLEEIKALPVPAADDAVLFLWTPMPKLSEALSVLEAWGFEYRSGAVWDKQRIGMGYYFRQQHELLLVGTRGQISVPPESARVSSVIKAPRGRHSAKPAQVYELIEAMYPGLPRIELFARTERKGWDAWGNEASWEVSA